MPFLDRPDGRIHYRVWGSGFPVLLFAPGGLRSRMEMWSSPAGGPPRPWVDWPEALPRADLDDLAAWARARGLEAMVGSYSDREFYLDAPAAFVDFVVEAMLPELADYGVDVG